MLNRLEISNFALIENVSLKLERGFSVITGETGAGKSILLKALGLLLGERADTAVLKQSEKKCFLEAEFNIAKLGLKSFFEANELDYDDCCILRREFSPSGKSRGFINDSPVQMTQLKELGDQLIAIHSQHQTLALLDNQFQLEVLDAVAGIEEEIAVYRQGYKEYRNKVNEHIELKVKDMENRKEKDYLSFLINELHLADLDNTDMDELTEQANRVENAEKIAEQIGLAKSVLDNDTFGPEIGIKTLTEAFEVLAGFSSRFAEIHGRLTSLKIEFDDIKNDIEAMDTDPDLSESEARQVKEKMDLLNSLTFKHHLQEVHELKNLLIQLEQQLDDIDTVENRMNQLELEIEQAKKQLRKQAAEISEKRHKAAPLLTERVKKTLTELAMEHAELEVGFTTLEKLAPNGLNEIEFQFKTNKGGQFLPIKKIASGGELSRLMLAVLSLLSEHKNLPTLIFDEIDTGVSGEVASKIANEFTKMGQSIQLVAITHLPQVAAKGNYHYHVYKESGAEKTNTFVKKLSSDERVNELAKMISGEQVTEAAKENALHLLNIS